MPHLKIFLFASLVVFASCAQPQECLDCLDVASNCLGDNAQCLGVNMKFKYCYYQQNTKSKFFKCFSLSL